ncbi:fused MFS/spermidine synthase [soil metagenome]
MNVVCRVKDLSRAASNRFSARLPLNPVRALYTATLFVSSFLLFLVQPLAGRIILPAFGGAPAVWSATLVFFQAVLLLGYGYAHLSISKLGTKRQPIFHLVFLAVAVVALPFTVKNPIFLSVQDRLAGHSGSNPAPLVLLALAGLVGLPFFVVSAGAPLLQRWFATTSDPRAKDPYFLYAASNVGSMLALLAYPVLIEPRMTIAEQSRLWMGLYLLLIVGMVFCAIIAVRGPVLTDVPTIEVEGMAVDPTPEIPRKPFSRSRTILLGAVPSSLLTGVTTYVTANVAPIPLLWIVPLALYLLTFILAFASRPLLSAATLSRILPMVLTPLMVVTLMEATQPQVAILHLAGFFVAAWMCHARLNEERPEAARLTEFYFYMSLGGVIGGAFNGLLAPSIFNTLLEYPLALIAVGGLKLPYKAGDRFEWRDVAYGVGLFAASCLLIQAVTVWLVGFSWYHPLIPTARTAVTLGIPAVLAFVASDRPWRYAACLGAVVAAAFFTGINHFGQEVLINKRSFFGEHRVATSDHGRFHRLVHGNTLHGMQDIQNPTRPLTYYYPTGPIGQVFAGMKDRLKGKRVGLVGLGVGSLAAYGQPGERMTYFEIDPLVVEIARDSGQFTFLRDSKAEMDIVLGDARLTLARQPDDTFSLLALDAFSSDAIPIHLLTKEAMALYMRKLTPDGVLAVHVSNRYLFLNPVVAAEAKALGLVCYEDLDGPIGDEEANGKTQSNWMILARTKEALQPMVGAKGSDWSESDAGDTRPWTDDFSNVLGAFKSEE